MEMGNNVSMLKA